MITVRSLSSPAHILITGATGLLGKYIAKSLYREGHFLYLLIRNPYPFKVRSLLRFITTNEAEKHERIQIIRGDITTLKVIAEDETRDELIGKITHLYHAAALSSIYLINEEILNSINIQGTINILNLAKSIPSLQKLNHISAAYVSGDAKGLFFEDDLDIGQDFNNALERSKFIAEKFVIGMKRELPISVLRPTFLLGDSHSGQTDKIEGYYFFMELLHCWKRFIDPIPYGKRIFTLAIPASGDSFFHAIPVDIAAERICSIGQSFATKNMTYCIGESFPLTMEEAMRLLLPLFDLPVPLICYDPGFLLKILGRSELGWFIKYFYELVDIPAASIDYFDSKIEYDCSNAEEFFADTSFQSLQIREYLPVIVENFLKRVR